MFGVLTHIHMVK